jgi:hypothetical protein
MSNVSRLAKREGMQRTVLLLILSVATSCVAIAQPAKVPREKWVRHMRTALPTALCSKGTPIRLCFSLSAEECEESMSAATRVCIANATLPEEIGLPDQGRQLGGDIGDCATNAYVAANQSKYVPSEVCLAARREAARLEKAIK